MHISFFKHNFVLKNWNVHFKNQFHAVRVYMYNLIQNSAIYYKVLLPLDL